MPTRIAQSFGRNVRSYMQSATLQRYTQSVLYDQLADYLLEPDCVLELGVGPGLGVQALKDQLPDSAVLMGMDLAYQMCQQALSHQLPMICADAHAMPFQDHQFAVILSNFMLQWVDTASVLQELYRVLQPRGRVLAATLGPDTLKECRVALSQMHQAHHINTFLSVPQLTKQLQHIGFKDLILEQEYCTIPIKQPVDALRLLKRWGAHVSRDAHLSGLKTPRWLAAFSAAYPDHQMTFEVIYLHAQKPQMPQGSIALSGIKKRM